MERSEEDMNRQFQPLEVNPDDTIPSLMEDEEEDLKPEVVECCEEKLKHSSPRMMRDLLEEFQSNNATPSLTQDKPEPEPERKRKFTTQHLVEKTRKITGDEGRIIKSVVPNSMEEDHSERTLRFRLLCNKNNVPEYSPRRISLRDYKFSRKLMQKKLMARNVKEDQKMHETTKEMEVYESQRTLGLKLSNSPRRFCVYDSYEVGECSKSVQKTVKDDQKMHKKRKQMEVDESQRILGLELSNSPRRFCVYDSYEVGECRKSVQKTVKEDKNLHKKRKQMKEDDSEGTLGVMRRWKARTEKMKNPPKRMFKHDPKALGRCSKLVRKQVLKSDVRKGQCRLMLGREQVKKMMEEVRVENPGLKGCEVLVYGPDGRIFEMSFKMLGGHIPVLTGSWNKFVEEYGIDTPCDFLIVWMFRHQVSNRLCFAIDFDRFSVNAKLSDRILKILEEAGF